MIILKDNWNACSEVFMTMITELLKIADLVKML